MLENKFLFLRYKKEDFVLSDGISLESVEVRILPLERFFSNECSSRVSNSFATGLDGTKT